VDVDIHLKESVMNYSAILALLLSIGLSLSANASAAQDLIGESTDPATAAAVEQTAQDMKERATQGATAGSPISSPNIVRGESDHGLAYLSGGITIGDRTTMHAERMRYTLWVTTLARASGAYLAGADLRIVKVRGQDMMFERTMDGPWLFLALPPGQYDVSASLKRKSDSAPQTITSRVDIAKTGQRQVVVRFVSPADISPKGQNPSSDNPLDRPLVAQ
jgi:hypothetical protein